MFLIEETKENGSVAFILLGSCLKKSKEIRSFARANCFNCVLKTKLKRQLSENI